MISVEFLVAVFYPAEFSEKFGKTERQRRRQYEEQQDHAEYERYGIHTHARLYRSEGGWRP